MADGRTDRGCRRGAPRHRRCGSASGPAHGPVYGPRGPGGVRARAGGPGPGGQVLDIPVVASPRDREPDGIRYLRPRAERRRSQHPGLGCARRGGGRRRRQSRCRSQARRQPGGGRRRPHQGVCRGRRRHRGRRVVRTCATASVRPRGRRGRRPRGRARGDRACADRPGGRDGAAGRRGRTRPCSPGAPA